MADDAQIERGLEAYESYINSGVVIDRREMVQIVFDAMEKDCGIDRRTRTERMRDAAAR